MRWLCQQAVAGLESMAGLWLRCRAGEAGAVRGLACLGSSSGGRKDHALNAAAQSPELREHTEDAPNWGSCRQIQERGRVNAGRRETHPSCHEVVGREAFYMGSVVEFLDLQKLLGQACVVG